MSNNPQKQVNTLGVGTARSLEHFIEIGVYITLLCNFFILYGNSQDVSLLVSWPTRIMVSYIFLLAVVLVANNLLSSSVGLIDTLFVVFSVFTVLSLVISGGLGSVVPYMCFLMLPACLVLYRKVEHVSRIKKAIYIANFCYVLLFFYLSRQNNSHYAYGEYGIELVKELTLGYQNPNETGIYLLLSFLIALVGMVGTKKLLTRGLQLAMAIVVGNMLVQTESRTCIMLASVAAALVVLSRWIKVRSIFRWAVMLLPAITLLLVLLLPDQIDVMTFMDEALDTGRYMLYKTSLQNLTLQTLLFGNGMNGNMHNSYLSVLIAFGAPLLLLYICLLNARLKEIQNSAKKTCNYAAFVGLLAVVAHGIAEGTLLMAGAVYAGLAGLLFILALPEEEQK